MSDPTARIDQLTAAAKAKAGRYLALRARAAEVSVTESSKDGLVTVTVDSAGNVTDLRITDKVKEMSGERVAAAVLLTLRRAQARLPEKLAEVMAETISDDQQTVDTIVNNYRSKFPEPEPDEPEEPQAGEQVRRIGDVEDEDEPPQRVEAPPRPAPAADDGDEDWGDQSVFRHE